MIYFDCGTHKAEKLAFFNCTNEEGRQIGTFLIDFNIDEKFVYANFPDESEIFDISPCGTKVLTIDRTYEKRKRKTKIFNLKSKELLFETNVFFGYEAWFTTVPHLLVVRANVKGKSNDKLFLFDTQKNEIVHFMQGNNCLTYCSKNFYNHIFAYPNSRKKDEVILLDLTTFEEKVIHLGSKKLIHRVEALGNDEYFAIDGDFFGTKFNAKGEILWKTKKLDWEKFYYAPQFFILDNQIIFNDSLGNRFDISTGELIHANTQSWGKSTPFFDHWVIYNTGKMYELNTNKTDKLDIQKYLEK
ncbi:hypothetical protein CGC58_05325 [Capnocytophaga stomatis]|uniref:Uncharacterized protein n=1 Tax=Capnocytophaga stomatis TaxID=1848904 RepID=A0A250FVR8_9FLAO|nr:hypothetical protein [Capnocytophaga stomatis]ATA89193.1 hypothetical protein CGC58_05325 [Capnocytophaga stomatis]